MIVTRDIAGFSASVSSIASAARNMAAGNTVEVLLQRADPTDPISVTDLDGSTYVLVRKDTFGGNTNWIYYAWNIGGHVANIVTATWAGAVAYTGIVVYNITPTSGYDFSVDPLVDSDQGSGSGTAIASASLTIPTTAFVGALILTNGAGTLTAGSGYTLVEHNTYFGDEYRTDAATSTVTATYSASGSWSIVAAAFQETETPSGLRNRPISIDFETSPGVWEDKSTDVLANEPFSMKWGNWHHGPLECVAQTGTLSCSLRNDAGNSGGLQGLYSPGHTNCLAGFTRGMRVRVTLEQTSSATTAEKWMGRVWRIDPAPGRYLSQRTRIYAVDWMDELHKFALNSLPAGVTHAVFPGILGEIVDAMDAQGVGPESTSFDGGADANYISSLDDVSPDETAYALIASVTNPEMGHVYVKGWSDLYYRNRFSTITNGSVTTFTDATLVDLVVPGSLERAFNRVRVTTHPKLVTPNLVLCATTPSESSLFAPGESREIWLSYRDPTNESVSIGGKDFVDPVVATTDYTANTALDGSGTDLTASFTVTATFFDTTALFEVTNGSGSPAYLTKLQGRGSGVYNLFPEHYEHTIPTAYGLRTKEVDLRYQTVAFQAQGLAQFIATQYADLERHIDELQFVPLASDFNFFMMVVLDLGTKVTVSETVTGLSSVDVTIRGVKIESLNGAIRCRWSVESVFQDVWQVGISQFNIDAVFG